MNDLKPLIGKIQHLAKKLEAERDRILTEASQGLLADMQERIFDDGKASDYSQIGQYSAEPIYVPVPYPQLKNARLKKIGKTGKKTKKTQYFGGGYKEFRAKAGREANKVNLDLTGSLRLSMKIADYKGGKVIYLDQKDSVAKARGNEDRFKKAIFEATRQEAEKVNAVIERNVQRIINSL